MQCSTDLVKLRDSIISRIKFLRHILTGINNATDPQARRSLAFLVIELDNLIILGLRQYTKSSLLRSRTASGQRITTTVSPSSSQEAAAFIFRSLNITKYTKMKSPKEVSEKDEIVFRDPKSAEKVLIDYKASNIANLNLALSLNAEVFAEAKICRHFFAHRTRNTYETVKKFSDRLGIVGLKSPEHLLLLGRPGTGVQILEGWLADVENFFDLAV
jgi:hypothetical protein